MRTRRLLYLSAHQLFCHHWSSGVLVQDGAFPASEAGHQLFVEHLARDPKSIYTLLVNVAEEGFHIETIPFLRGADRETVIRRKLGQIFFNAPLTASLTLGHEKNKRKDERLLLAALTGNEHLLPWLKIIQGSGIALSGIHSLSLLAPSLFRKLRISHAQCLLLTIQDQTIRQSYLENGEIHFSRLAPLHNSSIGGISQAFSTETQKLQQYLTSQRLISRNQPITAYILAHPDAIKAIQASCVSSDNIRFVILDLADCARRTGLKTLPTACHSELLFLHLMAGSPSCIQFADDNLRHNYQLKQIRNSLYGLGTFAIASCLAASSVLFFEAHTISRDTQRLRNEAQVAQQRYNEIAQTFPQIPTSNETLRRVIDRYAALEKSNVAPGSLYLEISRALQTTPSVEIEAIDWKTGGNEPKSSSPTPGISVTPVPADSESAIVRGTLRLGTNANPRQALGAFTHFAEALQANPALQVDVLKRPFDVEPGKSLKGEDTTVEDNKPRSFSLQITRKIGS